MQGVKTAKIRRRELGRVQKNPVICPKTGTNGGGGGADVTHEEYMRQALCLARECLATHDVPVGCVVVSPEGAVIGRGRNRREADADGVAHAEIEAIRHACASLGTWRLTGCTLYVTLEPCPMCAGAILNTRLSEVRYGAREARSGCCGSVLNLFEENFEHHPRIYPGLLAEESAALLCEFFRTLRGTFS